MAIPKLSEEEIISHMANLPGWIRVGEAIRKEYEFGTFVKSLQFVNEVGATAEAVDHHPDIDIRFNKVTLLLSTHSVGGLTHNDIELAASCDDFADAIL
jgi:4a-hydroxytetrahydrobiopterin dehydratase